MGSRSFGSAFLAPLTFKTVNITAISLIVLWFFSPVATQALQRFFTIGVVPFSSTSTNITFINSTTLTHYTPAGFNLIYFKIPPSILSLFYFSLIGYPGVANKSQDLFDNPKIPSVDWNAVSADVPSDGWYTVPPGTPA